MASSVSPRMGVPGLQNLGNTCFFNAILQALAAVGSFREFLEQVALQAAQRQRAIPFTAALLACLTDLAPVEEPGRCRVVVPRRLNQELCTKLTSFRGNKQQDSQELLQFLINLVNDEQRHCGRRDGGLVDLFPTASTNGSITGSISDLCFEEAMDEGRWNPLYGLQVDLLQCSACGHYRPMTNRRFLDVSLSFGENAANKPLSLQSCLALYTAPEVISGVECCYCTATDELALKRQECEEAQQALNAAIPDASDIETELKLLEIKEEIYKLGSMLEGDEELLYQQELAGVRCRALRDCEKRLQFSRCPDVFCFHFNRKVFHAYSGSTKKLDTHVAFPIELDMSAFARYEQSANADEAPKRNGFASHPQGRSWTTSPFKFTSRSTTGAPEYLIYELVAVILHHGNERYGHFTAFRRVRESGQWFFISDDTVREATVDEVLRSCAYMLFYERKIRRISASALASHSMTNGQRNGVHRAAGDKAKSPSGLSANGSPEGDSDDEVDEAALASVPDDDSFAH